MRSLCLFALLALGACASDDAGFDGTLRVEQGPFSGVLTLDPLPPIVGDHVVTLRLDDAAGEPLAGAEVTVSPWMPAHGHGSVDAEAIEDADEPGTYVADPVWLNMPGLWELRVHVVAGDGEGRLVAHLEVP